MAKKCIFILGRVRSGKSRFAQELAGKLSHRVLFIATGEPRDEEMQASVMAQFECAEQSGGDPGKHARYLALADELSSWKFTSSRHSE